MLLSDRFLDAARLGDAASALQAGNEVTFQPKVLSDFIASIESGPSQEEMLRHWSDESSRFWRRAKVLLLWVLLAISAVVVVYAVAA